MGRSFWPVLFYSITFFSPLVSCDFGFTNPSFEYVQLSSPINLAWNGQTGQVTLRLMVYPGDSVQSYIPVAANLTTSSYTWIPDSLTTGSKWTLEGIDEDGNIASLLNPFAVQGGSAASPNTATKTLLQQNPTSPPSSTVATSVSTSVSTSTSQSTSAPASSSTSTSSPDGDHDEHSMSTGVLVGIFVGALLGAAIIVALITYIFLQKRRSKQNTLRRDSIELEKGTAKTFELEGNESVLTLPRPVVELKGPSLPGSVPTSMGERVELG